MFREGEQTGLTTKFTKKEQTMLQEQSNKQTSPTKRRGKPMGKRTGGRPCDKPREMSLSSLEKSTKFKPRPRKQTPMVTRRATSLQIQKRPNHRPKGLTKRKHRQQQPQLQRIWHHGNAPIATVSQPWQKLLGTPYR